MSGLDDYEFGKVYEGKISKDDSMKFATLFGEGSPKLTELINYCILNGIVTHACCKGHPESLDVILRLAETGYISFKITDNYELAYYLSSLPLYKKGIEAQIDYNLIAGKIVSLYLPAITKGMSEEYFGFILESLKKYMSKKDEYPLNDDIEKIVDYVFEYPSNDFYLITSRGFKKFRREDNRVRKISKCPVRVKNSILHQILSDYMSNEDRIKEFLTKK